MIAFLLALLLWMVGQGPTPAPMHGATVPAPASVAPAPDSGRLRHRPGTLSLPSPRGEVLPAPAAPTVAEPAPRTYFPQTWTPVLTPPPMPTDLPPVATGPELDTGPMCTDPIDCPPGG